jgi:diaminopimelate decarboxylase
LIDIEKEVWISFEFVNLWWWIWIPYKPEQDKVDFIILSKLIKAHYDEIIVQNKKEPLKIVMECWRMITWPYWYLVSKVLHITSKYKKYVGLDASMQCLMRPALYWAYHHITVLWKESTATTETYDITGSLCENNDKFAVNRDLPKIDVWDILIIHDAGAHWTAMWFNYNAKLRPAELLLKENWSVELIRKAETLKNYFETVIWINWFNY